MYLYHRYLELVKKIRDAVRERAQEIPKFRTSGNGAIRILAYPCRSDADVWLGGLSDFSRDERGIGKDDIVDYEHTFAITPGGSRVITGVWDGVEQKVDCYAYSALKIAHCSLVQDKGAGLISGLDLGDPYLTEDNGYGPHFGAICAEVKLFSVNYDGRGEVDGFSEIDFCGIYVCVSGADSKDDLKCAAAAIDVIREFFEREGGQFRVKAPELPSE